MELPVAFSPSAARDVLEATRRVLSDQRQPMRPQPTPPLIAGTNEQWVKVDSETVTDGRQAGKLLIRDPDAGTWTDGAAIKVLQVNGHVLQTGSRYLARMQGYTDADDMEFATADVAGADGATVSVSSTTVTNGTQPGNIEIYDVNANTWTQSTAIRVKQINGYVLATGKKYQASYAGTKTAGDIVYKTSDQSGSDTTFKACDSTGTTAVTVTEENGVIKTVT